MGYPRHASGIALISPMDAALAAFLLCAAVCGAIVYLRPYHRRFSIDAISDFPGKVRAAPVPRIGGRAIFLGILAGALLSYSDLHVPAFPKMREHQFELKSVPLTPENLSQQDCVVLVTDRDAFDYESIARHARLLVDTRGRYAKAAGNIVNA